MGTLKLNPSSGFSLIELLVSISIMVIITTVVLFNYAQFNSTILITNLAYEIALSIREAQVYGLGVKKTGESFDVAYGVHFNLSSEKSYKFFADINKNGLYDNNDIIIQDYTLSKGYYFAKFCVENSCTPTLLDITFKRPDPDAIIKAGGVSGTLYGKAEIYVSSPRGDQKKVIVGSTGQIFVKSVTQ